MFSNDVLVAFVARVFVLGIVAIALIGAGATAVVVVRQVTTSVLYVVFDTI